MLLIVQLLLGLLAGIVLRLLPLSTGEPPRDETGTTPEQAAPAVSPAPDDAEAEEGPQESAWARVMIAIPLVLAGLGCLFALLAMISRDLEWPLPGTDVIVDGNWPLALLLICVAVLAIWTLWQVPRWQAASWREAGELSEREIFDIENSARGTLGQILSGVAVLAGLIFAWQQLGSTSQSLFVSQEGQITDRFTRAVEQLGSPDLTIRLGGIYALERISRDSPRDNETVLEILAAFARQRSTADQALAAGTPAPVEAADRTAMLPSIRGLPLDIDTTLKVIGRRDVKLDGPDCINLSGIDLSGSDLEGYNLTNVCLRDATLVGVNLRHARLVGVDLIGANFTSADLDGANLTGAVLTGANFTSANLSQATLDDATLIGAELAGVPMQGTRLRQAMLNGANLSGALLAGTDFTGADLLDVDLTGAVISGVNFTDATNLTAEQLDAALLDGATILPAGLSVTPDF